MELDSIDASTLGTGPADRTQHVLPIEYATKAPAEARRFVVEHATELPTPVLHDALLLVSELVTNAIRHGAPQIMLRVKTHPPRIQVSVEDGGTGMPRLPTGPLNTLRESGHGLFLVDAIAAAWGVIPSPTQSGKTVWFELGEAAAQ